MRWMNNAVIFCCCLFLSSLPSFVCVCVLVSCSFRKTLISVTGTSQQNKILHQMLAFPLYCTRANLANVRNTKSFFVLFFGLFFSQLSSLLLPIDIIVTQSQCLLCTRQRQNKICLTIFDDIKSILYVNVLVHSNRIFFRLRSYKIFRIFFQ